MGQRHLRYLKEYRRATYITLLTSGRLNAYLADIDRQAQERMERLTEQMERAQGITEQLKAERKSDGMGSENEQYIIVCKGDCGEGNYFFIEISEIECKYILNKSQSYLTFQGDLC